MSTDIDALCSSESGYGGDVSNDLFLYLYNSIKGPLVGAGGGGRKCRVAIPLSFMLRQSWVSQECFYGV